MYQTDMYEGMLAETITIHGYGEDVINAYFARPMGTGPFPGMVVIHHAPGWDEWYKEATRRYAHHGYAAICPNLYCREGHGTPEDIGAKVRAAGGVPMTRFWEIWRPAWNTCVPSPTSTARSAFSALALGVAMPS